jgi:hypothetical protein
LAANPALIPFRGDVFLFTISIRSFYLTQTNIQQP